MSASYSITTTDGDKEIVIYPNQVNGFPGFTRDTDLKLHGISSFNWGAGINENLLRLLENFAIPKKETGDYNPLTGNNDYDELTDKILPKDFRDLGEGLGINQPIEGQLWFNTTDSKMFVYANKPTNEFNWIPVGSSVSMTQPINPDIGELWLDLINSTPSTCITDSVLKLYNPLSANADADGWVLVIQDAVKKCGDTMSGDLKISKSSDNTNLTLNSNVGFQRSFYFSTSDLARWAITANSNSETGSETGSDFIVSRYDDNGDIISGHPIQIKRSDGKVILNGDPIEPLHAVTKQYVDIVANPDTGVVAGTYNSVTVNVKGKVTAGTTETPIIPSGASILFTQVSAPVGWVQDVSDNANNRMLRVVNTAGGGIGGSHSPILNNVVPAHTHSFNTGTVSANHVHSGSTSDPGNFISGTAIVNISWSSGIFGSATGNISLISPVAGKTADDYSYPGTYYRGFQINAGSHAHSFSTGTISANHTHAGSTDNGSSQINWSPRYLDLINCTKT